MPFRALIAVPLVAAAVVLAGCSGSRGSHQTAPYQGFVLDPAQPRPAFTLVDTNGKRFDFATETAGHPTLLFFGYTNCPDVCPTTMADINTALVKLPKSLQQRTDVVFVTTDIRRDTGPVIARWLAHFTSGVAARFIGLRGTQAQVDTAQAAAHVAVAEDGGLTHSAEVLLYGSDNWAHVAFAQSESEAEQMRHDLPLVAGTQAKNPT